eukprot:GHVT01049652.1.p1 GENE.GHVT01049652.1~~GHVT01049652.1.p1  ORF type:complete len:322 (+),score=55.18 GHVT01049652.1:283-1248(+)
MSPPSFATPRRRSCLAALLLFSAVNLHPPAVALRRVHQPSNGGPQGRIRPPYSAADGTTGFLPACGSWPTEPWRPAAHSARTRAQARAPAPLQMMPIGVPKVPYRLPGSPAADWIDIYNRLYRERIVFIGQEIDEDFANQIVAVLLFLDSEDSTTPIHLYINSPGGSVVAGLALYDTIRHVRSPVVTINVGLSASVASFLLAAGSPGRRFALPHSRVMIHQPIGGAHGQAEDIKVEAMQILKIRDTIVKLYSQMTKQPPERILRDLDRDKFFSAEEAKAYGIVDHIIQLNEAPKQPLPSLPTIPPTTDAADANNSNSLPST